jgi:hypothetical protein
MKKTLLSFLALFLLTFACTRSTPPQDDNNPTARYRLTNDQLALLFSHNINGETQPCGCHQFPRGGLAQMLGLFTTLKDREIFYVDSGDAFFPSAVIPQDRASSLRLTALAIADSLDLLGLRYMTPGDQDFALGLEFLQELASRQKFRFLISNLKDPMTIKHREWIVLERGDKRVFMGGLVDPQVFTNRALANLFVPLDQALESLMAKFVEAGFDSENPQHRLVLLSHAGLTRDRELAASFPRINWIIGSHTSSFTQIPARSGETTIVQVLSRNHFAGEIHMDFKSSELSEQFTMHEVKDDLDQLVSPNPVAQLVGEHIKALGDIQLAEQRALARRHEVSDQPFQTFSSCLDCHGDQAAHWERTTHSLAYLTLVRAGQPYDLSCIQCHALGTDDPRGFLTQETMVKLNPAWAHGALEGKPEEELRAQYWTDFKAAFGDVGRLKDKSPDQIVELSHKLRAHDERFGLTHNFAHVQCLNCHDQHHNHPFHINPDGPIPPELRSEQIKNRCLSCHDSSQSPNWYTTDAQGLPGEVDQEKLAYYYKKISCPSLDSGEDELE